VELDSDQDVHDGQIQLFIYPALVLLDYEVTVRAFFSNQLFSDEMKKMGLRQHYPLGSEREFMITLYWDM
jgi:hypothetical protein